MLDVPVLTVASIDPVLRDSTVAALLLDLPRAVAVRHDITPDGLLHRAVHDRTGVRDRQTQPLEHGCLSCALRADLLPLLRGLVNGPADPAQRPEQIVVGLPVSSEPLPLVHAITGAAGAVPGARAAAVIATASPAALLDDLFGDDLLAERHLELDPDDRRSVGEALAAQLEYADVVLFDGPAGAGEHDVLDHLCGPDLPRGLITEADAADLVAVRRRADDPRGDLLRLPGLRSADTDRVWSLDLSSDRPFHPDRLQAEIETMGTGPVRARGTFWLPSRPQVIGIWDGAGGQLSIGAGGQWPDGDRLTRLRATGIGPQQEAFARAFHRALMTTRELDQGPARWLGVDDGFGPWLGDDADIDDLSA